MHLGLTEGPFVPHNLISVQESAVPLLKLQMAPRLKILMSSGSKKGTQIYYPFLSKSPGKRTPSRFPNWALTEWYLLTGHFYVSLNISPFIFPSESPVREPPPCSLTGSPWTGILSHQSHWSIYLFIYLFIYSFVYVCRSPQKGALLHMGKNIRSPSTEPHTDRKPTYNGCGLVPQGETLTARCIIMKAV